MNEQFFPPLPHRLRIPFQDTLWGVKELFFSLFAVNQCDQLISYLEKLHPKKHVSIFGSGSSALLHVFTRLRTSERHEVVVPSFMCSAVVKAIIQSGCKVTFVDTNDYGNIDVKSLYKILSKKTLAVVLVHYNGKVQENTDDIYEKIKECGAILIDDCCMPGTHSYTYQYDIRVLSFNMGKTTFGLGGGALIESVKHSYPTKKMPLKELVILVRDIVIKIHFKKYITPFYSFLCDYGVCQRGVDMSKRKFLKKLKPYGMHPIQAYLGQWVLRRYNMIVDRHRTIAKQYTEQLAPLSQITVPTEERNIFTKYTIQLDNRYELSKYLAKRGIETQWTFYPLHMKYPHLNPSKNLLHTEQLWRRTLSLPISTELSTKDISYVCRHIKRWYDHEL